MARSLDEFSVQALYKSSLGKISVRDLLARSLGKISLSGLCTRSLEEVSVAGSLCKLSIKTFLSRSLRKMCFRLWIWKWVPRHNESDLTGPKCREGCASDFKQVRHATTRAIWPVQGGKRVARALFGFSAKHHADYKKWTWKMHDNARLYLRFFVLFFCWVYKVLPSPWKLSPRHPKCWTTRNHHHVHKTLSKFTKYCTCHGKMTSKTTSYSDPRPPMF